eukprot:gene13569-39206_t
MSAIPMVKSEHPPPSTSSQPESGVPAPPGDRLVDGGGCSDFTIGMADIGGGRVGVACGYGFLAEQARFHGECANADGDIVGHIGSAIAGGVGACRNLTIDECRVAAGNCTDAAGFAWDPGPGDRTFAA